MTIHEAPSGETTSASRPAGRLLWVPLVSIWMLLSASFTLPGRTAAESLESVDALALFKIGVRGLVLGALVLAIMMLRRNASRAVAPRGFATFGIFVLWALFSSLWSPLPAFSAAQAVATLMTQFLLAVALALAWGNADSTSTVLGQLGAAFLLICATLLVVHAINPELSGLRRVSDGEGTGGGLFHAATAGGTASLGLVLVLGCRLIWGWRWTRVLLLPSLVVFPIVMVIAVSRTALGLAIVLTVLLACGLGNRRWLGVLALVGSLGGIMCPLADPGLEAARRAVSASIDYASRGESTETLQSLTGRTALWSVLWESFLEAPFVGYGYLVTSNTGRVDVWNTSVNRGAHNLFLQVALSTGLIGLGLFLVGLWRMIAAACRRLKTTEEGRRLRRAAAVLGVWYLAWGATSESFMGGLEPESVLAFSLLGLMAGFREQEAA